VANDRCGRNGRSGNQSYLRESLVDRDRIVIRHCEKGNKLGIRADRAREIARRTASLPSRIFMYRHQFRVTDSASDKYSTGNKS
jgi:hypothetical protein